MSSPITIFNQLSTTYKGIGTCLRLLPGDSDTLAQVQQLVDSNFKFVRIVTGITDPGFAFQGLGNFATDALWQAESIPFQLIIDYLANLNIKIILCIEPPVSWLTMGSLTGSLALSSFATLVVAAYKFFNDLQNDIIHSISLFNEPDVYPFIFPNDLISLSTLVKNTALSRNFTNIKLVGPSLSQVSPKTYGITSQSNLFRLALLGATNTFHYWDIHAAENSADSTFYNSQDYNSRIYMKDRLLFDKNEFESVNFPLEKIVSKLITKTTSFPGIIGDSGTDASNTIEYGIRIAENFTAALENRFGIVLFAQLTEQGADLNSILDSDLLQRPFYSLLKQISSTLPVLGSVYQAQPLDKINDTTIKTLVIKTNSMSFSTMLCRPLSDIYSGKLTLTINNPIWTPAYQFANVTFSAYPSTTDLSETQVSFSKLYEGSATFRLINIPYNCIVFFSANLEIIPPPSPQPPPTPTPYLLETIIQVPMFYGTPLNIPIAGTIYYDTQENVTKVYDSSSGWIQITPLLIPI